MEEYLNTTLHGNINNSEILANGTFVGATKIPNNDDDLKEKVRMVHVIARPTLVTVGTIGNILSFYVMRRGSLKTVSTCFYMSALAIAEQTVFIFLYKFSDSFVQF